MKVNNVYLFLQSLQMTSPQEQILFWWPSRLWAASFICTLDTYIFIYLQRKFSKF